MSLTFDSSQVPYLLVAFGLIKTYYTIIWVKILARGIFNSPALHLSKRARPFQYAQASAFFSLYGVGDALFAAFFFYTAYLNWH